jgi:alpha-D-ribose 1-methylphosphonate 5-triphosphate synthase subunit PhnH
MSLAAAPAGDLVLETQRCFRTLLEAMSRPGRVQSLAGLALQPPAPLGLAAAATQLTLADADTPVWLDPEAAAATDWLRFHAGCPLVAGPDDAEFVLGPGMAPPPLAALRAGSEEAPHDAATLILLVEALESGSGWRLAGPGIAEAHHLQVRGVAPDFPEQWSRNHARYPLGVDVILCAGDQLAALPRSVRLTVPGAG